MHPYFTVRVTKIPLGEATVLGGHLWRGRGKLQPPRDRLAEGSCCRLMSREKEKIPLLIHKISFFWSSLFHFLCLPYCSQHGRGFAAKDLFPSLSKSNLSTQVLVRKIPFKQIIKDTVIMHKHMGAELSCMGCFPQVLRKLWS